MINAKELRIGNYVSIDKLLRDELSNDIKCEEIIGDYFKVLLIESTYINLHVNNGEWEFTPSDLQPIPLTEEWLIKFGFQEGFILEKIWLEAWSPGHPSQRFDIYYDTEAGITMSSRHQEYSDHLFMRHIKHIHQLQNLYFALTGEELNYKS